MRSAILTAIFWCVFMDSLSTFRAGANGPVTRTSSTATTLASAPAARPSIIKSSQVRDMKRGASIIVRGTTCLMFARLSPAKPATVLL